MKTSWKKKILCPLPAIALFTLLVQAAAFAGALEFGREKLKGTSSSSTSAPKRPNIAEAQKLTAQAYDKVIAAQRANEWDTAGHASS